MIKNKISLPKINKFFLKNKISIHEIKKFLNEKGFSIKKQNKKINDHNIYVVSKTFLVSLIVISLFSISPILINFTKQKMIYSKDYANNSKNNLTKVLENQDAKLDSDLDEKYLFDDIFEFDDLPSDTVRLSAVTIQELFKSTDYNLKDIRKNKLVKPISLTLQC